MTHLDFKVGDVVLKRTIIGSWIKFEALHITELHISGRAGVSEMEAKELVPRGFESTDDLIPWSGTQEQMDLIYEQVKDQITTINAEWPVYRFEIDGEGAFVKYQGLKVCVDRNPHLGREWRYGFDISLDSMLRVRDQYFAQKDVEIYKYTSGVIVRLNNYSVLIDHSKPFTREKLTLD